VIVGDLRRGLRDSRAPVPSRSACRVQETCSSFSCFPYAITTRAHTRPMGDAAGSRRACAASMTCFEDGPAATGCNTFGQVRLHPLSLARGQDHDGRAQRREGERLSGLVGATVRHDSRPLLSSVLEGERPGPSSPVQLVVHSATDRPTSGDSKRVLCSRVSRCSISVADFLNASSTVRA